MKISHIKSSPNTASTFVLQDMPIVTWIVKQHYDPQTFNCAAIANVLSKMYSNIEPVKVTSIIHNGTIQNSGHIACKIKGTRMLIDPVGDYLDYTSMSRLKHGIVPWLYVLSEDDTMYLSQDHMPFTFIDEDKNGPDDVITDRDIIQMSAGPFFSKLRAVMI